MKTSEVIAYLREVIEMLEEDRCTADDIHAVTVSVSHQRSKTVIETCSYQIAKA